MTVGVSGFQARDDLSRYVDRSSVNVHPEVEGNVDQIVSTFYYRSLHFNLETTIDRARHSRISHAVLNADGELLLDTVVAKRNGVVRVQTNYGEAVDGASNSSLLVETASDALFITGTVDDKPIVPVRLSGPIVIQPCSLDVAIFTMSSERSLVPVEMSYRLADRAEWGGLADVIEATTTTYQASRAAIGNNNGGVTEAECWKCWKQFYCCLEGGRTEKYCDAMLGVCNITCGIGDIISKA